MAHLIQFSGFTGIYFRKTQTYMKRAFKKLGISFDEGIILLNVYANPNTTQDRIAELLSLDAAAVARGLKSLEQKDCLTREIDIENQRRKLVNISPAGQVLVDQITQIMQIWDEAIFEGLSAEEIRQYVDNIHFFQERASEVDISALLEKQQK